MKIGRFTIKNQLYTLLFLTLFILTVLSACKRSVNENPVLPPETRPLTREFIGYGVIIDSFTHLMDEPGVGGISMGYLRQGLVVRVLERRQIINSGNFESWVLVEGNFQNPENINRGWLQEAIMEIYNNESRANTASRTIIR